ncbi:amidase [Halomonas sp. 141]|jgi:Asp-tRNA(Asn)/Glu-tRNA(Gln) amidotransferase A subunit family amidase|uniref:amidase n=1 Tax=Halomonadaceae TaxID=28256 RepID=UPI000C2ABB37|nr:MULTISPECIES: amidase [Halomonas]MDK2749315.1 amidase [Halomonas meridiana]MEC9306282.1 amidase [Pseudomonadota bacterium]PJX12700.1 amidase [Halomonas sp. 141]|tara:strand:+ start:1090 stop:2499 length:1410 start_codon:yes stop_codon:yes gene_type:complete
MLELHQLTATQLLEGYRAHTFSPKDVASALVAHIAQWEPSINALYGYQPEVFIKAAEASTQRWAKGKPSGALDGVPVTLKELIATEGVPVPLGTGLGKQPTASADAPPAARLSEDRALVLAKTTCPDFGMLSSGLSSFHGITRNPWNLACNTGGSSSGAGAAAAAGFGPLHVGTDIGGSVRLPAAWCGIVGFKPTLGRIPIDPYYVGRCAGPMTRSVEDAALMMNTLARTDRRDAMRLPPEHIDWMDLALDVKGLRIGVMMEAGCGLALDEEIRYHVEQAARLLEAAGATLVPMAPVLSREMLDGLDHFWQARQWSELSKLAAEEREQVLPAILAWADGGARLSGVEVVQGFQQTMAMRRATESVFETVDAVISPTTPNIAFPAEWASPTNDPRQPFEHIAYTVPWNMGEQPAISLNAGLSKRNMPIGVQLIGPRFADHFVLKLARQLEARLGLPMCLPMPVCDKSVLE